MVIVDRSMHICPNCEAEDVNNECEVVIRDKDDKCMGVVGCCIELMDVPHEYQHCPICGEFLGHRVLWQDITTDEVVGCDFCLRFEKAGDYFGAYESFEYDIDD